MSAKSKGKGKKYTFISTPDVEDIMEERKGAGISYDFTANSAIRSAFGPKQKKAHEIKTKAG